ncbi:MAG: RNase adapter RapZ [Erysipelotrichaceae bacterium]|nr:RNase adapter RapZ [Erysipelotrichaceae bacterium]
MNDKFVLITGMSGAGKSTAMSIMEDIGYHCIDQMPSQLVKEFVTLIRTSNDLSYRNVALSTTLLNFAETYQILKDEGLPFQCLFLDASFEQLLLRYKFTKHKHPMLLMKRASSLEEAISLEQQLAQEIAEHEMFTVDTTFLSHLELKKYLESSFAINSTPIFSISFVSFGYKYGVPKDADLLFDVRFLPNPYWEADLRDLDGDDQPVYDYVIYKEETQDYLARLTDFLTYSFEQYSKEGRNHLMVGIGCTGGQHRSMSIVNYLFDYYSKQYTCFINHRDKREKAE